MHPARISDYSVLNIYNPSPLTHSWTSASSAPDRILNRRSFLLALVFTGLNRIQKCGIFFQAHIQYNVHDWVTFCPDGLLLQILSILSVLNMFHFLFLFLPIFGKFQSQAADSVKRFQFASQQNIDHFWKIFSFIISSECFSVLSSRLDWDRQ